MSVRELFRNDRSVGVWMSCLHILERREFAPRQKYFATVAGYEFVRSVHAALRRDRLPEKVGRE